MDAVASSAIAVVPYAGTWIETVRHKLEAETGNVVPYAGTWIETIIILQYQTHLKGSCPTRARGLKPRWKKNPCGNLPVVPYAGTWIETRLYGHLDTSLDVVPYAGTWIETSNTRFSCICTMGRALRGHVD